MAQVTIDTSHDCEHGDDAGPHGDAVIPVHTQARSGCCGAILAEGGTDAAGYACTGCSQPCSKVMGEPTAHWTCKCGTRRKQVVTQPEDVPAEA